MSTSTYSPSLTLMIYQHPLASMAVDRANAEAQQSFADAIASVARRLYFSTPRKSESEGQLLQDVMRGRFPMKTLERLSRIASQSTRPEHREAIVELLRQWSTPAGGLVLCVATAFDSEDEANWIFNRAQRRFEREPSRATLEGLNEAGQLQIVTTRQSIDAARRVVTR